jgi:hypothetical protein
MQSHPYQLQVTSEQRYTQLLQEADNERRLRAGNAAKPGFRIRLSQSLGDWLIVAGLKLKGQQASELVYSDTFVN